VLIVGCLAALLAAPAGAQTQPAFGFADTILNHPYTVTIDRNGDVHHTGRLVRTATEHLTSFQMAALTRVAAANHFSTLPALTRCPGTPPTAATTWVKVSAEKVEVHGTCLPRYQRVLQALIATVHITSTP
jgi:hypothetical protein